MEAGDIWNLIEECFTSTNNQTAWRRGKIKRWAKKEAIKKRTWEKRSETQSRKTAAKSTVFKCFAEDKTLF